MCCDDESDEGRTDDGVVNMAIPGFEEGNGDIGVLGEPCGESASGELERGRESS